MVRPSGRHSRRLKLSCVHTSARGPATLQAAEISKWCGHRLELLRLPLDL